MMATLMMILMILSVFWAQVAAVHACGTGCIGHFLHHYNISACVVSAVAVVDYSVCYMTYIVFVENL